MNDAKLDDKIVAVGRTTSNMQENLKKLLNKHKILHILLHQVQEV